MQALLSREDMRSARSIVRWVGIGVQPQKSHAAVLLDTIKLFDAESTSAIRRVAEEINLGSLASQEVCRTANIQLQKIYETSTVTLAGLADAAK